MSSVLEAIAWWSGRRLDVPHVAVAGAIGVVLGLAVLSRPVLSSWSGRARAIAAAAAGAASWALVVVSGAQGHLLPAVVGIAVAAIVGAPSRSTRSGRVLGVLAITIVALAGLAVANAGAGWAHTLRGAVGYPDARQLSLPHRAVPHALADDPLPYQRQTAAVRGRHGAIEAVTIPSSHHFRPRTAWVYLPPAARDEDASGAGLPVLVVMTGQPGEPSEVFTHGGLDRIADGFAARHGGDAPVIVVPDQLQRPGTNPMCVDSPIGESYSYLTQDVPSWISQHLPVTRDHRLWAVAGYSQGGTCALQLGLKRPDLFATFVDISGETAPTIGSRTIRDGFHGSAAAYHAEQPLTRLQARRSWAASDGMFGFGELDSYWGFQTNSMQLAAARAGMATQLVIVPGKGHSWSTVHEALAALWPDLTVRLGLRAPDDIDQR